MQKGVGSYIRKRLRSHGVDLDDQGVNQTMAQAAVHFGYATIDLSMASDTISKELVYDLLPVDWAIFLDDLRSPAGILPDGSRILYEKFSSMGNGYTFELESMVFYALSRAVIDHLELFVPPFVYGDDLVIPSECFALLSEVFSHCGFEVNTSKSFVEGQFYESCGRHFFGGHEVTPIYQKEIPDSLPAWIRAGNRLYRYHDRSAVGKSAWLACRRFGGSPDFAIPHGTSGDDGWLTPRSEFKPRRICRNRGFQCRVIRFLPIRERVNEPEFYAYRLRTAFETRGGRFDHLPVDDSPEPFTGKVTRGASQRFRCSHRWVIPAWVETDDLR
jgi:hypothetical protein